MNHSNQWREWEICEVLPLLHYRSGELMLKMVRMSSKQSNIPQVIFRAKTSDAIYRLQKEQTDRRARMRVSRGSNLVFHLAVKA